MKKFLLCIFTFLLCLSCYSYAQAPTTKAADCADFLNKEMRLLHSKETVDLCQLTAGKVVLVVNTASNCGFTPQFKSLEALHQQYKEQGIGRWAMIEKTSKEFVGWTGFKLCVQPVNNHTNFYDIGYRLLRKFWSKGYATEAAIATLNYAFHELHILEVVGRTSNANIASKKVLEKAGMKFWKEGKAHGLEDVQYYKMRNPYL